MCICWLINQILHIQFNKQMKKILASLFVTSVAICSASAANAQAALGPVISTHTGTIPASCRFSSTVAGSIVATDGILAPNSASTPTSLNSENTDGSLGSFKVICNSNHTFAAQLLTASKPLTIADADYIQRFKLIAPSTHPTITTGGFTANSFTVGSLTPSAIDGYVVRVAAEAKLSGDALLPVGTYVVRVQATVTAN
jgi:hypothetical protein